MSKTTTSALLWLPSAANGVSAAPSSTAWVYGSWVEVAASTATAVHLAYVAVLPNDGATVAEVSAQIEVGIGTAGNETAVARTRVRVQADQWGPMSTIPLGLIYSSISASSRVSVRVAHGATADTDVYRIALGYYSALGGASGWTNQIQTVVPIDSASATIAGTTSWANGAWTELLSAAAVTEPIYVTGVVTVSWSVVGEIQLGTGGAGSESVIMTLPYNNANADSGAGTGYVRLPHPIRIETATRVSMRQRANTSDPFFGTIWYMPVS